jgi:hypothetical protein
MWFTLLADLLGSKGSGAMQNEQAAASAAAYQRTNNIMNARGRREQAVNAIQPLSATGKYDMNNLIGGVFSNKPAALTNSAWGQYGV